MKDHKQSYYKSIVRKFKDVNKKWNLNHEIIFPILHIEIVSSKPI